jgi:hypothetical protein
MSPQMVADVRIDDEKHKELLADTMRMLAAEEPADVHVPTVIDRDLETAPIAWYIAYGQNVREEDIPQA